MLTEELSTSTLTGEERGVTGLYTGVSTCSLAGLVTEEFAATWVLGSSTEEEGGVAEGVWTATAGEAMDVSGNNEVEPTAMDEFQAEEWVS